MTSGPHRAWTIPARAGGVNRPAVQFMITEVGSDLVPTKTTFEIRHNGRVQTIRRPLSEDTGAVAGPPVSPVKKLHECRSVVHSQIVLEQ